MRFVVYLLICILNGKTYVGITKRGADWRWPEHVRAARSGCPWLLHRAIRKYGPDAFAVREIAECRSLEDLLATERLLIVQYGSNDRKLGYNMTSGGEGARERRWSPAQREKHARTVARPEVKRRIGDGVLASRARNPELQKGINEAAARSWTVPEIRRARLEGTKATFATTESQERRHQAAVARMAIPETKAKCLVGLMRANEQRKLDAIARKVS